jgi:hypothetical protein
MLAHLPEAPSTALLFENLKSPRRLALCTEAAHLLRRSTSSELPDVFAQHTELDGFEIFAGDGSYLQAACHDSARPSSSAASGQKKFATGHFFGMDLRAAALFHLALADQSERRQEHDMRAKESDIHILCPFLLKFLQALAECSRIPSSTPSFYARIRPQSIDSQWRGLSGAHHFPVCAPGLAVRGGSVFWSEL